MSGFPEPSLCFQWLSGVATCVRPIIVMGTFRSGFTPGRSKARSWVRVGFVTAVRFVSAANE